MVPLVIPSVCTLDLFFSSLVLVKCKATSLVKTNGKKQLMDYPTEGNPIPCLQIRQC